MKLILNRSQKKHAGGSFSFVLFSKVEISQEEADLIRKYNQENIILGKIEGIWNGQNIMSLGKGCEIENWDVMRLIALEERMKEDCEALRNYLTAASLYQGKEEIDFTI